MIFLASSEQINDLISKLAPSMPLSVLGTGWMGQRETLVVITFSNFSSSNFSFLTKIL